MSYALIEDGVVVNIITLHPTNLLDFPNAVLIDGRPVGIGDAYVNGIFTHNGVPILTTIEEVMQTIAALDATVIDLSYQNALLKLGLA